MKSNITKEQAQSALNLTAEIIDEFGPRLTGTPACKKAGERLKAEQFIMDIDISVLES